MVQEQPGAGDLMHPLSPTAPYLPAAANMSNPAAKERGHLDDLPAPDTAIPADPDLLPVAPFLLSSGPNTGNNDDSESPFFVVGRTEGSTASLPHSRLRSPSRANAEYGTSSDILASEGVSTPRFPYYLHAIDASAFSCGKSIALPHRKR